MEPPRRRPNGIQGGVAESNMDEPLPPDHGKTCDIQRMYRTRPDDMGHTSWSTEMPDVLKVAETEETAKFALLVRYNRCYDGRREFVVDSIVVQSQALKTILGDVLEGYPGVVTNVKRLEFSAPWHPFVHRWAKLLEIKETLTVGADKAVDDAEAQEKKNVVVLLCDLLYDELKDTLTMFMDLTRQSSISYPLLWALFEPGCIVFSNDRLYKVAHTSESREGRIMQCQFIDWNGQIFGYAIHVAQIDKFSGARPIQDLSMYPLQFHDHEVELRQKVLARTAKLQEMCGLSYKQYDGVAEALGNFGLTKVTVNSRVVLDTASWNDFNPNLNVAVTPLESKSAGNINNSNLFPNQAAMMNMPPGFAQLNVAANLGHAAGGVFHGMITPHPQPPTLPQPVDGPKMVDELTEEQMLITVPILRGYSCKDKRWMRFNVDNVSDIVWDENAFDSLVMPTAQKELVRAVAESQAQNSQVFDDIISGKGKGMILLLIGPPGVGKTLTAESVAEAMKVPLYYMSSIDLGTTAAVVETTLPKVFKMVTKWKAVLLLDEADVFLQKRDDHDLERNKLVSVMLRTLEYYEGLLMLTTNRGGSIDDAFQSRIHLRLNYADLTEESRRVIWKNFLATTKYAHQVDEGALKDLAARELNGRQIKNLLKTAILLAARKSKVLKPSHIEFVLSIDPQA